MNELKYYVDNILTVEKNEKQIDIKGETENNMAFLYKITAEKGNNKAQFYYGLCCLRGIGVSKNKQEAKKWLQKASDSGLSEAKYEYACILLENNDTATKAVSMLEEIADYGGQDSQNKLGECYLNGIGVSKNYQKAKEWFAKAGNMEGKRQAENEEQEERECKRKAEEQRARERARLEKQNSVSTYSYSSEEDYDSYIKKADNGSPYYQYKVGMLYLRGKIKQKGFFSKLFHSLFSSDEEMALRYIEDAGENGYLDAQLQMAYFYENGQLVEQSKEQAFYWYQKAAENGHLKSILKVANSYYKGDGVGKSINVAIEFYKKAANMGNEDSMIKLGDYFKRINNEESLKWYKKAADVNNGKAQLKIGLLYHEGYIGRVAKKGRTGFFSKIIGGIFADYNTEPNYEEAINWYKKASSNGSSVADYNLGSIYEKLEDIKNAIYYYEKADRRGSKNAKSAINRLEKIRKE